MLEPLFHGVLAVPGDRRAAATASIPFLNGGLFERRYGEVSLDLPDALFDLDTGLLGYLNHWTFTVAEETADEQHVLGRQAHRDVDVGVVLTVAGDQPTIPRVAAPAIGRIARQHSIPTET